MVLSKYSLCVQVSLLLNELKARTVSSDLSVLVRELVNTLEKFLETSNVTNQQSSFIKTVSIN